MYTAIIKRSWLTKEMEYLSLVTEAYLLLEEEAVYFR